MQDYQGLPDTKVYVADAGSTDDTVSLACSFADRLRISVIPGGLPSAGRNAGARRAMTRYVLFVDADIAIADKTLVRRSVEQMKNRSLHCLTTNIRCMNGEFRDHILYAGNNLVQRVASWTQPFATGMYMMFDREVFFKLGGFDEKALYAEDYLLTKKVAPRRFGIVGGHVLTTNRRFQKMGHWRVARMFLNTALHTFDHSYFLRDQGYWTDFETGSTQAREL
jgi:glycosyltransferase involved in cell wall biosynthesis